MIRLWKWTGKKKDAPKLVEEGDFSLHYGQGHLGEDVIIFTFEDLEHGGKHTMELDKWDAIHLARKLNDQLRKAMIAA